MIFTATPRTDDSPKRNRESDFAFLDRSSRPEIEKVRQFLEALVHRYPREEVGELIARIRSGNDTHFKSATFELMLYAGLERRGFKLQPHPELQNGSTSRPDFHVTGPDGSEFYLEAVLASENNGADPAAQARIGVVLDALALATHANFLVSVEDEGVPTSQPSGRRLRSATLAWLNELNPDQVQAIVDAHGLEAAPTFLWTHEDWQVTLRAIPLRPERRGTARSLVGALHGGAGWVDAWTPIRNAVRFKGSKYGELSKPLLVAVNFDSFHLNVIDEMQALYGQEQFVVAVNSLGSEPRFERVPNGAWYGKKGPQSTGVSGVWIFNDLSPYTAAVRRHRIYFNPWASYALPGVLMQMPHAIAEGQQMRREDGLSLRQLFDLPEAWPE